MLQFVRRALTIASISLCVRVIIGAAVLVQCFVADPVSGGRRSLTNSVPLIENVDNVIAVDIQPTITRSESDASPTVFFESEKLVAADGASFDQFGFSVAISGNTAVVAADRDDDYQGAVNIYVKNGVAWDLQQKLTGLDSVAEDSFGWSVAISGDTVVVGAYLDDIAGTDQGSAYIFTRNGTVWSQQQRLSASDAAANDQFGVSVAISGDTVIVGAFGDDSFRGSAYVFARNGAIWTEQQKLTASVRAIDSDFGWSVGISSDTAVVGSNREDADRGSAYIFLRNGSVWQQQQKLVASDGTTFSRFGHSVSINGDSAAIGSVTDNVGGARRGSAFVFARNGGFWSEQQKLIASDGAANDKFGGSIAIDGESLIVGAEGSDIGSANDRGAAYVFSRSGNVWSEAQRLSASDGAASDFFGGSVAIGGGTILVGGYLDDNGSTLDQGSAYIFEGTIQATPTPTPTATPAPTPTATTTPTPTATPTPSPLPGPGFEGDVSERPNGDGLVLTNDIAQMRRFIVGLDVPDSSTNEFQRADIAPFASAGDGTVNSADATQARRYVTGLDPVQAAGGPTEPIAANGSGAFIDDLYDYFYAHEVRLEQETIGAGTAVVAVVTDSAGSENGLSFTLEFDASRLGNPKIALGSDAPENSALTLNMNDVESGRIGILIDSSANIIAGPSRQILTVSFDVKPGASSGSSTLRFTDTLAPKSISDIFGKSISSKFVDSAINISSAPILSGRVTMPDGRGIRSAAVFLTDADGGIRKAVTGSFGNYLFDSVQAGQRYTISVQSKRFRFAVRIVEIADDLGSVDLIAIE